MEDKYAGLCFQTLLELLHKVPVANIESGIQCKVREHFIVQNFSLWVAGLHRAERCFLSINKMCFKVDTNKFCL